MTSIFLVVSMVLNFVVSIALLEDLQTKTALMEDDECQSLPEHPWPSLLQVGASATAKTEGCRTCHRNCDTLRDRLPCYSTNFGTRCHIPEVAAACPEVCGCCIRPRCRLCEIPGWCHYR
eukprot:TRINITY_DN8920_c3_g4_i2.p1 TRINITY_DN8920_c3_g4~~TRINITY_DN8920_c3_g4_i2.p1  ORF type:complete len:120 (+),score=12.33 TRINITY_DN8920_c3_g4_i2:54-413(+)